MAKKSKDIQQEKYLKKFKELYGDSYDYSEFTYTKAKEKSKVWCKKHQEFFWVSPDNHVRGKGCPKCGRDRQAESRRKGWEEFVRQAQDVHKDRYTYPNQEYINSKTKVRIVCSIHKDFWQAPCHHLDGAGCPRCGGKQAGDYLRGNWEDFVKESKRIHNGKYIYPKQEYVAHNVKVRVVCKQHGDFWQTPNSHKNGNGCPDCARKESSWYKHSFYATKKPATLYLLRAEEVGNIWWKVGITKDISVRFRNIKKSYPKAKWGVVHIWEGPAYEIFNLERTVLFDGTLLRYKEENWDWAGYTECFRYEDYEPLVQHINSVADTLIGICQTK